MARLYVSRLERDVRADIEESRYSEMELEEIRCDLQRTVEARGKAARIAAAALVAFDAFYAWAEFFANPNHVMGRSCFPSLCCWSSRSSSGGSVAHPDWPAQT